MSDLIEEKSIKSYVILFGFISVIIALLAFTNKTINGQNLFRQVNVMSGTFGNKNFLSSILFFCLPFYFIGISMSKKIKAVSFVAIVFTILLLLMLRTRVVLIALSIYLLLVVLLQIRSKVPKKIFNWSLVLVITALITGVFYLLSIKDIFHSSADIKTQYFYRLLSSDTLYARIEYWQQALYIIKDNFFSGIGVGNWIATYPKYGLNHFSDTAIVNGRLIVSNPHNDFLMVLSEIGIFGFLCYLGIFISILYQANWLSKNEVKSSERRNASYFLFFIVCYLIIAFFDFPLTRIEHQIILLIVFAIINAKYLKANSTKGFKLPSRLFYLFSFVLLLYSMTIALYRIDGEKHLLKALAAEKRTDNTTAIFEFNKAENAFFSTDTYAIPLDWHLGKAHYNEGNFEESLKYYSNAYKVNPYCLVVNNDLASTYIKNGRVAHGIRHYKEALTISPNYEDARINLAATYYNTEDYEKAFETIDKCDSNSKNESYKQFLTPIVEKKLNETLLNLNNPKLNNYLKSKIKTENDLLTLYFDYKRNNTIFDKYIQSLIN
ncbi:O-antigen ligase family protein [Flavobacterium sp.]|uniref:O-antigen ligase family protein n=1 Tax=Flavobacterium sp. TaxID=239 RepID=UPI0024891816|nr:O-antigen ligase family protein [Flavobacterium sp.]MDI1316043.1 O-antigen ligase family protein [Flavobacterium sp.]